MSNQEKYPNNRNLENVEDGFDDDLDVPTYRKLADSEPVEPSAAPQEDAETTIMERPQYDAYVAAGRSKPQVIKPEEQPTTAFEPAEPEPVFVSQPEAEPEPQPVSEPDPQSEAALAAAPTTVAPAPDFAEPESTVVAEQDRDFVDEYEEDELDVRRGTTNFGLLILRLGVGALLILHGLTTLFGWANSGGVGALEADFANSGFRFASVMGIAIPTVQLIAGALLVLGLATPLGAGLALALSAYLTMFEVATSTTGWNLAGADAAPVQLQLLLTVAALALQFTGPGRIGIDFSRGWARRPLASSWIFCILGIAAAVVLWYFTSGSWPFMR